MLEIDSVDLGVMRPGSGVGVAGRKLEREALVDAREAVLEEPLGLREIGALALFVLIGNDAAWVAAGRVGDAGAVVGVELKALAEADLADLTVLDGVLVAGGIDAPGVHGEDFGILVELDERIGEVAALRAQNLDDFADMLDGLALGVDGVGLLVEEHDGLRGLGKMRKRLLRRGPYPVG